MVKGVTKQVVFVRPQGEAMFEQALFIVRSDARGLTEEQLLAQATELADCQLPSGSGWRRFALGLVSGGTAVALAWFLTVLL